METACELYLNAGDRKSAATVVMEVLAMNPPDATKYQQWLAQIRAG
jgi:Tfp pilus assembly protein FimV